jgi:hypothetical protein
MASRPQFFLKTHPLPGESPSPYTGLYLRHHAGGINSVVLTLATPKFIKGHEYGDRISFTSASHEDRIWGLTLRTDGQQRAGWEKVEIVQDGGSEKLVFSEQGADGPSVLESIEEENGERVWKG